MPQHTTMHLKLRLRVCLLSSPSSRTPGWTSTGSVVGCVQGTNPTCLAHSHAPEAVRPCAHACFVPTWLDTWPKNAASLAPALPRASTMMDSCVGVRVFIMPAAGPDSSNRVLK